MHADRGKPVDPTEKGTRISAFSGVDMRRSRRVIFWGNKREKRGEEDRGGGFQQKG